MIAAPLPTPGQCWSLYRASYTGERADNLPAGESAFVLATTQADSLTFLSLEAIQRFDVRSADFATMRAKRIEYPPRKLAAHLRAVMSRNERHGKEIDEEVADLALTALGWKPDQPTTQPSEKTMLDVSVGEPTFSNLSAAKRSAARKLGKPDAQLGVDFEIKPLGGGKVAMTLKTGANGKTEKIAKGPTGIERQFAKPVATKRTREQDIAHVRKAVESVKAGVVAVLATDAALAKAAKKPAGKPAKAPKAKPAKKPRKGATRPPKRSAKEAKAAAVGIAAAIAERHGADVFKGKRVPLATKVEPPARVTLTDRAPNTMNGKKIPDGPSKAQVAKDVQAAKVDRVIATVAPNPKRPSAAAHARYALYKVGMSEAEFVKAGGTKGDLSWDARKGFITFKDAG